MLQWKRKGQEGLCQGKRPSLPLMIQKYRLDKGYPFLVR